METIQWYEYLEAFFAGLFLANTIPHYIHGVSGNKFPTPFANPPGKGLSSPLVNTLWASFNLVIGYILFRFSGVSTDNKILLLVFLIGVLTISIFASIRFSEKNEE